MVSRARRTQLFSFHCMFDHKNAVFIYEYSCLLYSIFLFSFYFEIKGLFISKRKTFFHIDTFFCCAQICLLLVWCSCRTFRLFSKLPFSSYFLHEVRSVKLLVQHSFVRSILPFSRFDNFGFDSKYKLSAHLKRRKYEQIRSDAPSFALNWLIEIERDDSGGFNSFKHFARNRHIIEFEMAHTQQIKSINFLVSAYCWKLLNEIIERNRKRGERTKKKN